MNAFFLHSFGILYNQRHKYITNMYENMGRFGVRKEKKKNKAHKRTNVVCCGGCVSFSIVYRNGFWTILLLLLMLSWVYLCNVFGVAMDCVKSLIPYASFKSIHSEMREVNMNSS